MKKLFYNFNFKNYLNINLNNFTIEQEEILLKNKTNLNLFLKEKISYECSFTQIYWKNKKPVILIPIRNNSKLLLYTIKNLLDNNINLNNNIIIIDDRSSEDLKSIVLENNLNYLRIDNKKGFNFSMLNNIGALIGLKLKSKEIILWNSDLWCHKEEWLEKILNKHRKKQAKISGTKLLYPPKNKSLNKEDKTLNILNHFSNVGTWRETVQFGGAAWMYDEKNILKFSPLHYKRFIDKDSDFVNCDRGTEFITGAFQIWDLDYFVQLGGLNPSLASSFQDVDICLRAIEDGETPMYFGKDMFFYHDESAILSKDGKKNLTFTSDHVIFAKIWNEKINKFIM